MTWRGVGALTWTLKIFSLSSFISFTWARRLRAWAFSAAAGRA
jgi:hypothetical protein